MREPLFLVDGKGPNYLFSAAVFSFGGIVERMLAASSADPMKQVWT